MLPSYQGLGAAYPARLNIYLRLQIHYKLPVFKSLLHLILNFRLFTHLKPYYIIINRIIAQGTALYLLLGRSCPVAHKPCGDIVIDYLVYTVHKSYRRRQSVCIPHTLA